MPLIRYVERSFVKSSLEIINNANIILNEYAEGGYRLTLRQLFYQFVTRELIQNTQKEYKRLGSIINDGRLAGLIDWDAIEDRGRNLLVFPMWKSAEDFLTESIRRFKLRVWDDQPSYVEVWIEKEALIGVIGGICSKFRVPHFACKGYTSQSEMWAAGHHRLRYALRDGKNVTILHLGDHDPSGLDMTRDVAERLRMFATFGDMVKSRSEINIERIALNMNQIEQYDPPPNPAKQTDARFNNYSAEHGDESWELDALSPDVISGLIEEKISALIDWDSWDNVLKEEESNLIGLNEITDNLKPVLSLVGNKDIDLENITNLANDFRESSRRMKELEAENSLVQGRLSDLETALTQERELASERLSQIHNLNIEWQTLAAGIKASEHSQETSKPNNPVRVAMQLINSKKTGK